MTYVRDDCPRARELHTPCPTGYMAWHEWAAEKSKTHKQVRCPECDLFAIWVPKRRAAARDALAVDPPGGQGDPFNQTTKERHGDQSDDGHQEVLRGRAAQPEGDDGRAQGALEGGARRTG